MINGKRGEEQLLSWLIQLFIIALFLILVLSFVKTAASGKLVEEQLSAKQIALLLDNAIPNTTLVINSNSIISIENNKVKVQAVKSATPYEYEFYSSYAVIPEKIKEGVYKLEIK